MPTRNNSTDYEKIVLTAAALLEHNAGPTREFSVRELRGVFSRGEPCMEHLVKRGLLMSGDSRYRLFSAVLGPWIVHQIAAELSEEKPYHEWLAKNRGHLEQIAGKQGGPLRDILPKVRTRYRELILTWASDPQTFAAMTGLLKSVLVFMN